MATPNDYANYASSASWFINAPAVAGGNKRLRAVESYDEDQEGSVETRTEVGPGKGAAGFVTIPGGRMVTFEIREIKSAKREVDWEYLERNEVTFSLTKKITSGRRSQYPFCRVSSIKPKGDNKGEHTYTVEIVTLDQAVM